MKTICIVHFQPLEKYPPAFNFLRCIEKGGFSKDQIHVITTSPPSSFTEINIPGVTIHRVSLPENASRSRRLFFYLNFHYRCWDLLKRLKPVAVLYYETLSAFAPVLYKQLGNTKLMLLSHYHEYTSPAEYQNGMIVNRLFHLIETPAYSKMSWVSHTNENRARLFRKDLAEKSPAEIAIVPNYPPDEWTQRAKLKKQQPDSKIQFVYVGALSDDTMYVSELFRWIDDNQERYSLTIYTDNYEPNVMNLLSQFTAGNIHFKGAISYDKLPEVLPGYDVGLILYRGTTFNYTYNAPNKFFEYLNCGLNVIYPSVMVGMDEYKTVYPDQQILSVDFSKLEKLELDLQKKPGCFSPDTQCTAEQSFGPLIAQLTKNL